MALNRITCLQEELLFLLGNYFFRYTFSPTFS